MISSRAIRTSIVIAGMAVAACAHAQISLIVVSNGFLTDVVPPTDLINENVVAQSPLLGLTTYSLVLNGMTGAGVGTYFGVNGNMTFNVTYLLGNVTTSGPSEAVDGTWSYLSGTGVFAGMTGGGTLAEDILQVNPTTWQSGSVLSGTLNAVPEPAPSAVIGAGVLGLCLVRRRKR